MSGATRDCTCILHRDMKNVTVKTCIIAHSIIYKLTISVLLYALPTWLCWGLEISTSQPSLHPDSPASKRLTGHSSSFLYKYTDPLCYMIHYCTISRCCALSSLLPIACYGISYALLLQLPKCTLTHFACKYSKICLDMLLCIYVYILSSFPLLLLLLSLLSSLLLFLLYQFNILHLIILYAGSLMLSFPLALWVNFLLLL